MQQLFGQKVLNDFIRKQDEKLIENRWQKYKNFLAKKEKISSWIETDYQDGFLEDIFENCLGYISKTRSTDEHYTLEREKKNETNAQKADGALLVDDKVVAVIELKDLKTKDLDKKYNREESAVRQAFGYLQHNEHAKYVIVSNFNELRFYFDKATAYEQFFLFDLDYEGFKKLHTILSFESISKNLPQTIKEKSLNFEQDISNQLYKDYTAFRTKLFENILKNNPLIDKLELLNATQKLIDRIVFILFGEDTDLLPKNTIGTIIQRQKEVKKLVKNFTLYDSYKVYFEAINSGDEDLEITMYNGGLFADDELLNKLIIDDEVLDARAKILSAYNFGSDISVNILGHIFENSISELEEISAQLLNNDFDKKLSKRKKDGVFYTPAYITEYIVQNTLGKLCEDKREELNIASETLVSPKNPKNPTKAEQQIKENLLLYKEWLLNLKILDPACGSGAFLNQALEYLLKEHKKLQNDLALMGDLFASYEVEKEVLEHNLYGVDINEGAVEIARLSLWLRTAKRGRPLTKLANKIKVGNSLIDDKTVVPNAFDWHAEFSEVFAHGGFDVVIGNPPYVDSESMTKFYKNERIWIAKNYKTAVGNWDIFIPFVELGLSLLKNNQYLSFIIPNKILSANYGSTLREYINENYSLNEIFDLSVNNVFEIDVYPVIVSLSKIIQLSSIKISYQKGEEVFSRNVNYKHENNWALYLDINYGLYSQILTKYKPLNFQKEFSLYSSASVSEAYEIKEFIDNNKSVSVNFLKLINTGTIDPYSCSWGISSMTYIKDTYMYPIVNLENIKKKIWTQKPKIAFAGMATRIEAFIDTEGVFLPLKSTTVLTAENESSLKFIGCILNSKLITFIFKIANSANTMAGGYLNINQDNLGMLPIPNIYLENQQPFIQKADKMLSLNKQLQETKQNFLNELKLEKLTKKLQNFEELTFEEFIAEYTKALKLKFADKLQERNFKQEWQAIFENDKTLTCNLKTEIDKTDKEIDEMVYKLYDLSEDEIKIVESAL